MKTLTAVLLVSLLVPVRGLSAPVLPPADLAVAEQMAKSIQGGDFDQAWAALGRLDHPSIERAMRWYLLQHQKSRATFEDLAGFVLENQRWRPARRLRRRAEAALTPESPPGIVAEYFSKYAPRTVMGWKLYRAALAATESAQAFPARVRVAWRRQPMGRLRQQNFLALLGTHLRPQDHRARLTMLLRRRRGYREARALIPLLTEAQLPAAVRRVIALRVRMQATRGRVAAPDIDTGVDELSAADRAETEFLWDHARWLRRRGELEAAAARLKQFTAPVALSRRWLVERTVLAFAFLREGKNQEAYAVISAHRQKAGYGRARSEFIAGWIALRRLNQPLQALEHFRRLYVTSRFSVSRARGAYWAARANAAANRSTVARHWFQLAARYPLTFYGQLARRRLKLPLILPKDSAIDPEVARFLHTDGSLVAAWLFVTLEERKAARTMLWDGLRRARSPQARLAMARLAARWGHRSIGVRAAGIALLRGDRNLSAAYPSVGHPAHPSVERALVLGVIRQESEFHVAARSYANARGLMQLLPGTARQMARQARIPWRVGRLTTDGAYNVRLGSRYLDYLLRRFDGAYVLAVPAYNAGPGRVSGWLRKGPDPRDPNTDIVDWIELIPISETRNYVQRVLANLAVYRALSGDVALDANLRAAWQSQHHTPPREAPAARRTDSELHPDPGNRD